MEKTWIYTVCVKGILKYRFMTKELKRLLREDGKTV
jgi:hypothetical protein